MNPVFCLNEVFTFKTACGGWGGSGIEVRFILLPIVEHEIENMIKRDCAFFLLQKNKM